MRWRAAMVASAILFHGVHTSAFAGQPAETARPAPDAAVAVAIGLAWADRADEPFEWIRVCGPNGCRLMPRLSPPGGAQASPGEDPDAAGAGDVAAFVREIDLLDPVPFRLRAELRLGADGTAAVEDAILLLEHRTLLGVGG